MYSLGRPVDGAPRVRRAAPARRVKMVNVGQHAPDFSLPAHTGQTVTLGQYRGRKNVVLSFHLFSFTGG